MMKKLILFLLILALARSINYGQSKAQIKLNDNHQTQTSMNISSYEEYLIADSILNNTYQKLLKLIDNRIAENDSEETKEWFKELRKHIVSGQISWIKMKESNSNYYEKSFEGGSIMPLYVNTTATQDTYYRIKTLEGFYSDLDH